MFLHSCPVLLRAVRLPLISSVKTATDLHKKAQETSVDQWFDLDNRIVLNCKNMRYYTM